MFEVETCLREYIEMHTLSLAWFFEARKREGLDKSIAEIYYQKTKVERRALAKRLCELTK